MKNQMYSLHASTLGLDVGVHVYVWFDDISIDDVVLADAESIVGGQENDLFAPALEEAASDVTAELPIVDQSAAFISTALTGALLL